MRLTDVMSHLGLSIYPMVALPLFLFVFVGVLVQVFARPRKAEMDRCSRLPLEDPSVKPTPASANTH